MRPSDPAHQFLTTLIWRWICVSVMLLVGTALGEWVTANVARWGWPSWSLTVMRYATNLSLGFSIVFGLLALITLHQRAQYKR